MTLMSDSRNTSTKLKREGAKNKSFRYNSLKYFDTVI